MKKEYPNYVVWSRDVLRARDEAIIDATWHFMDVAECWPDLEASEIDAIIAAAEEPTP